MRIQSPKAGVLGLWLLAAACGAPGTESATARTGDDTTGSEPAPPTARETASFEQEPSMSREEVAMEVPGGTMPATEGVAEVGGEAQPQERTSCPADLEGLEVSVASVPGGGALVLRVAEEESERLHARMRLFAKVHEVHRIERPGAQRFADPDALIHQATEVRVIDAPDGVHLEIRSDDPARANALRAELREDAEQLRAGNCPLALSIES